MGGSSAVYSRCGSGGRRYLRKALASGGVLRDEVLGVVGTVGFGTIARLWGIILGGPLSFVEGLILEFPLSAVLGLFGRVNP